ncbi:uncharacterized protein ARMOST_17827 [Armillaria ostoyae]|uniref:Uncharacterized protein n=1 Tax=Armillaria ostoyae TaxID=47428 RepID=A0A284S040_ARMOS|nr:uncharacterized protein ARMOST_17827 [Armillaria ostoyae]
MGRIRFQVETADFAARFRRVSTNSRG